MNSLISDDVANHSISNVNYHRCSNEDETIPSSIHEPVTLSSLQRNNPTVSPITMDSSSGSIYAAANPMRLDAYGEPDGPIQEYEVSEDVVNVSF